MERAVRSVWVISFVNFIFCSFLASALNPTNAPIVVKLLKVMFQNTVFDAVVG